MDNEDDIYGDLPNFNASDYIVKLETKVEVLEGQVKQLETSLNDCERDKRAIQISSEREKKCLSNRNENLLVNVSTLFKTAKAEIDRKDNVIKELRQQLDDLIFRRYQKQWPRNDIVQSQNEDDAICIKPTTEDRKVIPSIIRPNSKNYDYIDRNKSSSEDKSPSRARINLRTHEFPERDKYSDSSRVKYVESLPLESKIKDSNNYKYHIISSGANTIRDDHYSVKNFSEQYHNRKIDRRSREDDTLKKDIDDDRERKAHTDTKSKDRQRYSPYEFRRDEPVRNRHKHSKERRNANAMKSRPNKRSSNDRGQNHYETDDCYRAFKDNHRRQDTEFVGRKSHEDRRRDEYGHSNRIESDERKKDSDNHSRKSNEDRKWDESVRSVRHYVSDDCRQNSEFVGRKSIENRRKEETNYNNQIPIDAEPVSRKLIETVRREETNHNCRNMLISRRGNIDINVHKSVGDKRKDEFDHRSQNMVDDRRLITENLAQKSTIERKKAETVRSVPRISHENRRQSSKACGDEYRREELFYSSQNKSDESIRVDRNNTSHSSVDEDRHIILNKSINNEDRRSEDLNNSHRSVDESDKDDELDNFIKNLNQRSKEELEELNNAKYENTKPYKFVNSIRPTSPNSKYSCVPHRHSESHSRRRTKHSTDSHPVSVCSDSVEPSINDVSSKHEVPCKHDVPSSLSVRTETHLKDADVSQVSTDSVTSVVDSGYAPAKEQIRRHKHSNSTTKNSHRKKIKVSVSSSTIRDSTKTEESSLQTTEHPSSPREELCRRKKAKLSTKISSPVKVPSTTNSVDTPAKESSSQGPASAESSQQQLATHRSAVKLSQNSPIAEDRLNPLDNHMMVLEILAQYGGYYATPLKLLNGDKGSFANFKLVSPIADTPDHVKALLNDTKIKVSPIPMINEHRVLDEFDSPNKKASSSTMVEQPPPSKDDDDKSTPVEESSTNSSCCVNSEKSSTNDDKSSTPVPSTTSIPLRLDTVSTSPFKNCCIVKVKEDPVMNANSTNTESVVPPEVTAAKNTGTDSTNTEHGIFTRKRRAPVVRTLKKTSLS